MLVRRNGSGGAVLLVYFGAIRLRGANPVQAPTRGRFEINSANASALAQLRRMFVLSSAHFAGELTLVGLYAAVTVSDGVSS